MPDPLPTPPTPEPVDPTTVEVAPAESAAAGAAPLDAAAAPVESATEAEPVDADHPDAGPGAADPTEAELLRTAIPATVRRAPRYGAFITAGLVVGLVVGLTLAVVLDRGYVTDTGGVLPFLGGSNGPRLLSALTGGALGVLVGAGLALWADRRSLRR